MTYPHVQHVALCMVHRMDEDEDGMRELESDVDMK